MKKFVVECKPDEKLAKSLGYKINEIAHQGNKGEVCNYLMRNEVNMAMIDEDPWSASQPKLLKQFSEKEDKFDIKHLFLKEGNKNILILKPRLEEWILARCKATGIKPENHFLPSDKKEFKDKINYRLNHFDRLLNDLKDKNDEGLRHLTKLITNIQING